MRRNCNNRVLTSNLRFFFGLEFFFVYLVNGNRLIFIFRIVKSLQKIKQTADQSYNRGDQETAYILYMRYIHILSKIRNFPDYSKEKNWISSMLGSNSAQTIIVDKVEKLHDSLAERYRCRQQLASNGTTLTMEIDNEITRPATTTITLSQQQPVSTQKSITCQELYSLLKNSDPGSRYLIIDTRPRVDYESSHIFAEKCVNVPQDLLFAGNTAGKISDSLTYYSKDLWASRKDQEKLILMDWNTSQHLNRNSPIWHLHEILEFWDPDIEVKPYTFFVEGGYEMFKTLYPTKCLNPNYERQASKEASNGLNMEGIEYPSIQDISMKDNVMPSFGLTGKLITTPGKPKVDRSSKVNAINTYKEKNYEEVLQIQDDIATKSLKNQKELLEAENNLKKITEEKENVDTNQPDYQRMLETENELKYKVMQLEQKEKDFVRM